MVEFDSKPKFRLGEAANRPIGGNIADTPFTKAFRNVMTEAGFDSQLSLAHALNKTHNSAVSSWLTGNHFPRPEEVGGIIIACHNNGIGSGNKKLEAFLNAYGDTLRERELGIVSRRGPFEQKRKIRKSINTSVSKWIERFCEQEGSSLSGFFRRIGCVDVCVSGRGSFSVPMLIEIEGAVRSKYGKKTGSSFHTAVNEEIIKREKEGKSVKTFTTRGMRTKQRESNEPLYNGQQVANMLGTTRATVSNHRIKRGWDLLLTESQVAQIGNIMERNRKIKEKKPEEREKVFKEVQIYPLVS